MVAQTPPRAPGRFRLYYIAVLAFAALLFATSRPLADPTPLMLAVAFGLMVALELAPIPLPSGGYASGSAVVDLPCLVILGPLHTAVLDVLATGLVQGVIRRRPIERVVHNMAVFAITDLVAGHAYLAAGGRVGSFALASDLDALIAAGTAYFLVNAAMVSTVVGLTSGPTPWRVWERNFGQGILYHLSFVALGGLVAITYFGRAPWAVVLFAVPLVLAAHSFRLYVEIRSDLKEFVRALAEVLEEVDPYTRHHSVRVSGYAVRLARGLGLSEREVEEIEYAALVHDLGKIGPRHQHILRKPGALSHEEQRTMRAHPAVGAEIVSRVRALRRASEIVLSHHERPDGRGYPFGLRASDVPIGARILNVADAFDAMTSDRPYRRALSVAEALRELDRGAGTQFDGEVVRCIVRQHEAGEFPLLPSPTSEDLLHQLESLQAHG